MMKATRTILIACFMSAMLAALPTASALGNIGIGFAGAGASIDHTLRNYAGNDQGGGGRGVLFGGWGGGSLHSWSNCQVAILVNSIVTNLATAEGLGLVDDSDTEEPFPEEVPMTAQNENGPERTWDNRTSTSDCSQAIGPVLVSLETVPGWGEEAPQGDLADLAEAVFENAPGLALNGGLNLGVGLALAGASVDDTLENEFNSYQGGSGVLSAANCQILVTYNTMVLNTGSAFGLGEVDDEDTTLVDERGNAIASKLVNGNGWDLEDDNRTSTSTCVQTIESITLILGDPDRLPPQS